MRMALRYLRGIKKGVSMQLSVIHIIVTSKEVANSRRQKKVKEKETMFL